MTVQKKAPHLGVPGAYLLLEVKGDCAALVNSECAVLVSGARSKQFFSHEEVTR